MRLTCRLIPQSVIMITMIMMMMLCRWLFVCGAWNLVFREDTLLWRLCVVWSEMCCVFFVLCAGFGSLRLNTLTMAATALAARLISHWMHVSVDILKRQTMWISALVRAVVRQGTTPLRHPNAIRALAPARLTWGECERSEAQYLRCCVIGCIGCMGECECVSAMDWSRHDLMVQRARCLSKFATLQIPTA
jgi:hypothetical protein